MADPKQTIWAPAVKDVMDAFVGRPINKDTLSTLISDIQLATPGAAKLLPSDFILGEVRVQVEFKDHRIVASITLAGMEVIHVR